MIFETKSTDLKAFTPGLAVMDVHFVYYVKPQGTKVNA
jgi:hypothetical protein